MLRCTEVRNIPGEHRLAAACEIARVFRRDSGRKFRKFSRAAKFSVRKTVRSRRNPHCPMTTGHAAMQTGPQHLWRASPCRPAYNSKKEKSRDQSRARNPKPNPNRRDWSFSEFRCVADRKSGQQPICGKLAPGVVPAHAAAAARCRSAIGSASTPGRTGRLQTALEYM